MNAFGAETTAIEKRIARIEKIHIDLESHYELAWRLIWEPEGSVTPHAVFETLGNKGALLFESTLKLIELLTLLNPDFEVIPAPYDYTINPDGTVTLGEKIPKPEPEEDPL